MIGSVVRHSVSLVSRDSVECTVEDGELLFTSVLPSTRCQNFLANSFSLRAANDSNAGNVGQLFLARECRLGASVVYCPLSNGPSNTSTFHSATLPLVLCTYFQPILTTMSTDRLVVNAGGRRFETTATTLLSSGSGYFAALLGPTGAALGSLSRSEEVTEDGSSGEANSPDDAGVASVAVTPHTNGRKRARSANNDEGSVEEPVIARPKEIFVDRDPDLFADVLHFMRSARLPARTRQDMARLEDLIAEALFFSYDNLDRACGEALQELRAAMEDALKPEPQPTAKCCGFVVDADDSLSISVPEHKILYIASATLSGEAKSRRYVDNEKQREERRKKEEETGEKDPIAYTGCYISTCCTDDSGDFQLEADVGDGWTSIAHVAINHFRVEMEMGLNVDFRQDIRQCLAPNSSRNRRVRLRSLGAGDWHISCWIGDPSAIPLVSSSLNRSKESRNRRLERSQNTLAAAGAATTAITTMTTMTASLAMMAVLFSSLRN